MALIMTTQLSSQTSPLDLANNANRKSFILYLVFLVLAFIGTVYFTIRLFRSSSDVQEAIKEGARLEVESVKAEAKRDVESARNEANERISAAKSEADLKIAEANKNTAALGVQAKSLEVQLEQEKLERLKLLRYFSPRQVTLSQLAVLDQALEKLKGTHIVLALFSSDAETFSFADALETALRHAGLVVIRSPTQMLSGRPAPITFEVGSHRIAEFRIIETAFAKAQLSESHIPWRHAGDAPDTLTLIIGSKH